MSDAEYDELKQRLAGSSVYMLPREGPVCTLGKPGVRGQKQARGQGGGVGRGWRGRRRPWLGSHGGAPTQ